MVLGSGSSRMMLSVHATPHSTPENNGNLFYFASEKPQCARVFNRLDAIVGVEFGVDIFQVGTRGVRRNNQAGGNLLNRAPSGEQLEDGTLPLAEQVRGCR